MHKYIMILIIMDNTMLVLNTFNTNSFPFIKHASANNHYNLKPWSQNSKSKVDVNGPWRPQDDDKRRETAYNGVVPVRSLDDGGGLCLVKERR